MTINKRTRFEVLKRDNHTCRYCGATAPDVKLHIDHVTPVALGGTDTTDNLVAACVDCNLGKASTSPAAETVADVAQDAIRWATYVKQAEAIIEAREHEGDSYRDAFLEAWEEWHYGGAMKKPLPLPGDWENSIENFRKSGMSLEVIKSCVDIAGRSTVPAGSAFKYFCGVAWRRIREARDIAQALMLEGEPVNG
jgi:Restriction endonuclease